MANKGYPIRVNNIIVRELTCSGAVGAVADGYRTWWMPGYDATQIDVGVVTEAIPAITSECYNRAASSRTSGADGVMNLGCGFSFPEFSAAFISGMHESAGAGGAVQLSFDKPGEDSCRDCSKNPGDDCDPEFAIIADICNADCKDEVIDRELMVVRRISQATLANRKRVGGNNVDSFGGDITLTISTNDGFGYGPGGLLISDGPDGNPECSAVTCHIACPTDGSIDLSALDAMCGCAAEYAGCTIDAAFLVDHPEFDIPLLTLGTL